MKRLSGLLIVTLVYAQLAFSQSFISEKPSNANILIASSALSPTIVCDEQEDWLVTRAAELLKQDISMLTGSTPAVQNKLAASSGPVIIIGSLDKSK